VKVERRDDTIIGSNLVVITQASLPVNGLSCQSFARIGLTSSDDTMLQSIISDTLCWLALQRCSATVHTG